MRTIETERLLLRPFRRDDAEEIHRVIFSDPEVCRFYCGNTWGIEQVRDWIIHRMMQLRDGPLGFLAVVRKEDDALLGLIALQHYLAWYIVWEDDPDARHNRLEVELRFALGRDYWGSGYITEASQALIDYAFRELRLPRIAYGVQADNTRTINAMRRLGFRLSENRHPDLPGVVGILDNDRV